jgi:hypothetical protein
MGSALFEAASDLGLTGPGVDLCERIHLATSAQWLRLTSGLARIGAALDAADVPWIPFKGLDTAQRFFPRPELRLSSDVDLLVSKGALDAAMNAVSQAGWDFRTTPRRIAYQKAEGYAWQGRNPRAVPLELHYRLWGMVPGSLVEACWRSAAPDPDLGRKAFRVSPSMAFILCAAHSWTQGSLPQFIYLWEIRLIASHLATSEEVTVIARENGLQLPVGLVAGYVGRMWDDELCLTVGRSLLADLRWPERMALGRARRRGIDAMPLELLHFSRLLSGRPSRMGWRSIVRRVWPHPATIEESTPEGTAWWRRRLSAASRNIVGGE